MDKELQQIFNLFGMIFKIHIQTKTTDRLFHKESPEFYEAAFNAFHKIYERAVDLGLMPNMECETAKTKTMEHLLSLQKVIEAMIGGKNSTGFDNLLRSLADGLEDTIGNMKAFTYGVKEEKAEAKGLPIKS